MRTDPFLLFLAQAREWWAVADALRAGGIPDADPARWVWREAAWCHLLAARGLYPAAVTRLRVVCRAVTGERPHAAPESLGEFESPSAAADLFARMRGVVSARYPSAFRRPAAA